MPSEIGLGEPIYYLADGMIRTTGCSMVSIGRPRRHLFMPRSASRLTLFVLDARPELLRDITEAEARREGVDSVAGFVSLWNDLQSAGAWERDADRWVWRIEFRPVLGNIDQQPKEIAA